MKSGIGEGLAQLGQTAMKTGMAKARLDQGMQQNRQYMKYLVMMAALADRGDAAGDGFRGMPQAAPGSTPDAPRFQQRVGNFTLPAAAPMNAPASPPSHAPTPQDTYLAGANALLARETPDLTAGREQELLGRGIMAGTPVPPSTAVIRSPYR